MKTAP